MRRLRERDREHVPRDEIEARVCAELRAITGKEVSMLETRQEYLAEHCDDEDRPVDPGYDYIVSMSRKWQDWYMSGTEYGVNVAGSGLEIVELGTWVK